jgi:hypothetical protein
MSISKFFALIFLGRTSEKHGKRERKNGENERSDSVGNSLRALEIQGEFGRRLPDGGSAFESGPL